MVLLIDTNVIIDFLCKREPFFKESFEIIKNTAENKYKSYITANSITDIVYLLRKNRPIKEVKEDLSNLVEVLDIVDITRKDIDNVLASNNECDLEDELIYQCAKRIKSNYIITRDKKGFKNVEDISVYTPKDFLKLISESKLT